MLGKKKGQIIYRDPLGDGDSPEMLPSGENLRQGWWWMCSTAASVGREPWLQGPAPDVPVTKQKYTALPELDVCGDEMTLSPVLHRVVWHFNSRAGACSVWVIPGCEGT